jgi:hypothetical protein
MSLDGCFTRPLEKYKVLKTNCDTIAADVENAREQIAWLASHIEPCDWGGRVGRTFFGRISDLLPSEDYCQFADKLLKTRDELEKFELQ